MGRLCGQVVFWSLLLGLSLGISAVVRAAEGLEGATVEELIEILQSKGVIDGQERERLLLKHSAEREQEERLSSVVAALTTSLTGTMTPTSTCWC